MGEDRWGLSPKVLTEACLPPNMQKLGPEKVATLKVMYRFSLLVKSGAVWEHFVLQLCKSQPKIAVGSTRSMLKHLWPNHKIHLLKHKDVGDPCRSDEAK